MREGGGNKNHSEKFQLWLHDDDYISSDIEYKSLYTYTEKDPQIKLLIREFFFFFFAARVAFNFSPSFSIYCGGP